jgi:hypothetical protein
MSEVLTDNHLHKALHHYKRQYLNKQLENLDESSTRIIINHLLSDVLGYKELVDIKTEYPIQGGYIDYLIDINRNNKIVIEVKSIKTKIAHKHLRQAIYYAAIVGADWIILTNGRYLDLYKIRYTKPLKIEKIFSLDIKRLDEKSKSLISTITKRSVLRGDLQQFGRISQD